MQNRLPCTFCIILPAWKLMKYTSAWHRVKMLSFTLAMPTWPPTAPTRGSPKQATSSRTTRRSKMQSLSMQMTISPVDWCSAWASVTCLPELTGFLPAKMRPGCSACARSSQPYESSALQSSMAMISSFCAGQSAARMLAMVSCTCAPSLYTGSSTLTLGT